MTLSPPSSTPPTVRRVNLRLFAGLVGTAVALTAALFLLHRWQVDRNAESLLAKAEAAEDAGESQKAARFYEQYLKYRPNNIEAQARLGMLLDGPTATQKNLINAFLLFESVLREDPTRQDVRRRLADVLVRLGRFGDALEHVLALLTQVPTDAELLYRKAHCEQETRRFSEAAATYALAIRHHRHEIRHYEGLIELVLDQAAALKLSEIDPHQREEVSATQVVDALAERMVAQGRPRARALLARSRLRMRAGDLPAAVADVREALQLAEDDPDILFAAAEMELAQAEAASIEGRREQRQQHIDTAERIAKRGLQQEPPVLKLAVIIARIELERGDQAGAMQVLSDGLSRFPEILEGTSAERKLELVQVERQLLLGLVDLKIRFEYGETDPPTIGSLLERMRQLGTPREYLDFLLTEESIQEEEWAQAIASLERLTTSLRADRELSRRIGVMLARCYQAVGRRDARLAVLSRTVEANPLWAVARLEYARALADVRRIEDAVREYRMLLGVKGAAGELFQLRMLQELALPPNRRDWTRVEETLDLAARLVDPIQLAKLRAEVRVQQKKYEEAESLLSEALEEDPNQPSLHASRARLVLRRNDLDQAHRLEQCQDILKRAEERFGPQPEWEMIRAEMALIEPEPVARKSLHELKQRSGTYSPETARTILERLAQVWSARGWQEESQAIWRTLAHRHPQELKYWQALAQPLSDQGKLEKLRPILKQIRRIEGGNGPTSQFLLAATMLVRVTNGTAEPGELQQAEQILADTAHEHPRSAAIVRAQGYAAELGGDSDLALRYFQEALRLGDTSPEVVLRILHNLARRGQHEQAMQLVSRLTAEGNSIFMGDAGRFARALALQQQDLDGAVQFAHEVWKESQSFWDQLWLAEMRYQSGERGLEVDELYRQAVKQAPKEPATWLSLVRHLQRTGQFAEAQAMMAEAQNHLPPALRPPTLAQCHEILGNLEEAAKWYHQAVVEAEGDVSRLKAAALFHDRIGNREQAQKYLARITLESAEAGPADIAWTRRNQALLLAAEGGYDRSIQAVELLERNRGSHSERLNDLRAKALILSKRPLRKDRLEAIGVYGEIRGLRGHLTPDEQLQLACLYNLTGQWGKARSTYQEIVTADFAKPEHFAEFAVALIRQNEAAQAIPWVRMLEKLAPDAFVTATTRSRFTHSMGNNEQAQSILTNWIETHRPDPLAARLRRLPEATRFEQELAELSESPPADFSDEAVHLLGEARELIRQSRRDEARSLVHQFLMQKDLEREQFAKQLVSSARLLEEVRLLDGAEALYRDYADFTGEPRAVFVLAKFLSRRGRIAEGLELCDKVRHRADPELLAAAAVSVLGRSGVIGSRNFSPEQFRQVESWVKSALASAPESPACLVALADLRLLEQRLAEAETLYLKVLPANDRHVVALNNLAWLKAFLHDDPPEALRWINRAMEVAGPRADLLDTRAVIHIRAHRADEAIRDLEAALAEMPFAIGYLHLAEAKALKGEFPSARRNLAKAREMHLSQERLHPLEKQLYDRLIEQLPSEPKEDRLTSIP